ncbi:MAG: hypothetical protein ABIZ80_22025, partial [Bryobacteraceae bacterium]
QNPKQNLSLTIRAAEILKARKTAESEWVFPHWTPDIPVPRTTVDHQHSDVTEARVRFNLIAKAFSLFMNMDKMIGPDFEKGLAQMKGLAESGAKK